MEINWKSREIDEIKVVWLKRNGEVTKREIMR